MMDIPDSNEDALIAARTVIAAFAAMTVQAAMTVRSAMTVLSRLSVMLCTTTQRYFSRYFDLTQPTHA
jgi:hypothetical protein